MPNLDTLKATYNLPKPNPAEAFKALSKLENLQNSIDQTGEIRQENLLNYDDCLNFISLVIAESGETKTNLLNRKDMLWLNLTEQQDPAISKLLIILYFLVTNNAKELIRIAISTTKSLSRQPLAKAASVDRITGEHRVVTPLTGQVAPLDEAPPTYHIGRSILSTLQMLGINVEAAILELSAEVKDKTPVNVFGFVNTES